MDHAKPKQVVVQHRTNERGEFKLAFRRVTNRWESYTAWIYAKDYALRGIFLNHAFSEQTHVANLEIRLPNLDSVSLQVLDPSGAPYPGATVSPSGIDLHAVRLVDGETAIDESAGLSASPPDQLADLIRQTTDQNGEVELTMVSGQAFGSIDVQSATYGVQQAGWNRDIEVFQLAPTGGIRGRFPMDSPERVAGTELWIESNYVGRPKGIAKVQLGPNAEFYVPAIVVGRVHCSWGSWDPSLDVHPLWEPRRQGPVVAGEVLELNLETRPPIEVSGRVLTADTRQPVVGATVVLNSLSSPIYALRTQTDEDGRFTNRVASGFVRRQVIWLGRDRLLNEQYDAPRTRTINLPADRTHFEMNPILLPRMQVVHGNLRSTAGQPISAVTVIFHLVDGPRVISRVITDSAGEFSVPVRDWAAIQDSPKSASRYAWSILDQEQSVDGILQTKMTPLNVVIDGNEVRLEYREGESTD